MNHEQLSDEDLVVMVEEGRAEALGTLYDRYAASLYALALRVLGDRGAAEEVVQDAFVVVWRKAGSFDAGQGKLLPWLLRITRNRAIDELRRRGARPRSAGDVVPEEGDSGRDPTAREAVGLGEIRSSVAGALGTLPQDQREVLEMAYMGGLSQREISERTGIPLGTVKTRTRLALMKLRERLHPAMRGVVDFDEL